MRSGDTDASPSEPAPVDEPPRSAPAGPARVDEPTPPAPTEPTQAPGSPAAADPWHRSSRRPLLGAVAAVLVLGVATSILLLDADDGGPATDDLAVATGDAGSPGLGTDAPLAWTPAATRPAAFGTSCNDSDDASTPDDSPTDDLRPAADETPTDDTNATDEAPTDDTSTPDDAPTDDLRPAADETPTDDTNATDEAPTDDASTSDDAPTGGCDGPARGAGWTAFTRGDDPELDALWQACADGDLGTCDRLWLVAPISSDYESFASTCGGRRSRAHGSCG